MVATRSEVAMPMRTSCLCRRARGCSARSRGALGQAVLAAGLAMAIACAGLAAEPAGVGPASARGPQEGDNAGALSGPLRYPAARQADVVDDFHGTPVADPYRWLEDPDSPETRAWIDAQNRLTFGWLERIPARAALQRRLTELWDYEKFGVPVVRGGKYFSTRNDGLQNQSVLYVAEGLEATPRVLLDPNLLSVDGTVALSGWEPSEDGRWLAYGVAVAGSDWQEWRVLDVATGEPLADHLRWIKFSGVSWTPDGAGFYYSRYEEPSAATQLIDVNYFQKLYFHRLHTAQGEDALVYQRPDQKEWSFAARVSEEGEYLWITVNRGTDRNSGLFYQRRNEANGAVIELLRAFDAEYEYLTSEGNTLWVRTDRDAPRGQIVAIDLRDPQPEQWRTVVPEAAATLEAAGRVGDRLVAVYLEDASHRVRMFDLAGHAAGEVPLPALGTVAGFEGRRASRETFYSFASFNTPARIFRYDLAQETHGEVRAPRLGFRPDDYVTRQVFATSADGTRVPIFVSHRRDVTPQADTPCYLFGYGGFNISLTPAFSVQNLVWMERGGVLAVATLRGGGEYGRAWHQAGQRGQKQQVFDDFIAAAEWLIAAGMTSSERLAISGRSNGGLLVGACMTQRPELFGAALPGVGVLDMLRFHRFTIGWAWVPEYGTADVAEDFEFLYRYSPLHRVRAGVAYPATLITTADHDDRVVPAHSFKFAAALQAAQGGTAPVLIRIDTEAGHGAGKPTTKLIQEQADLLAFLVEALAMEPRGESRDSDTNGHSRSG